MPRLRGIVSELSCAIHMNWLEQCSMLDARAHCQNVIVYGDVRSPASYIYLYTTKTSIHLFNTQHNHQNQTLT